MSSSLTSTTSIIEASAAVTKISPKAKSSSSAASFNFFPGKRSGGGSSHKDDDDLIRPPDDDDPSLSSSSTYDKFTSFFTLSSSLQSDDKDRSNNNSTDIRNKQDDINNINDNTDIEKITIVEKALGILFLAFHACTSPLWKPFEYIGANYDPFLSLSSSLSRPKVVNILAGLYSLPYVWAGMIPASIHIVKMKLFSALGFSTADDNDDDEEKEEITRLLQQQHEEGIDEKDVTRMKKNLNFRHLVASGLLDVLLFPPALVSLPFVSTNLIWSFLFEKKQIATIETEIKDAGLLATENKTAIANAPAVTTGKDKKKMGYWSHSKHGMIKLCSALAFPFVSIDYAWSSVTKTTNSNKDSKQQKISESNYWGKAQHGLQIMASSPFALYALPFALISQLQIKNGIPFLRENIEDIDYSYIYTDYWEKTASGFKDVFEVMLAVSCLPFVGVDKLASGIIPGQGREEKTKIKFRVQKENQNHYFWSSVQRGIKIVLLEGPFAMILSPFVGIHKVTSSSTSLLFRNNKNNNTGTDAVQGERDYWLQGFDGMIDATKVSAAAMCLPFVLLDKLFSSISSSSLSRRLLVKIGIDVNDSIVDQNHEKNDDLTYWSHALNGLRSFGQTLFALPAIPFFVADRVWSAALSNSSFSSTNNNENSNANSDTSSINYWDRSINGAQIVAKAPFAIAATPFVIFDSVWCRITRTCHSNYGYKLVKREEYYWRRVRRGVWHLVQTPFVFVTLPFVGFDMVQQRFQLFGNLTSSFDLQSFLKDLDERDGAVLKLNATKQQQEQQEVTLVGKNGDADINAKSIADGYWQRAQRGGAQVASIPIILVALPLAGVDVVWSSIMDSMSSRFHSSYSGTETAPITTYTFWDRAMRGGWDILRAPVAALVAPFAGWGALLSKNLNTQKQYPEYHNLNDIYWGSAFVGGRALFGFFLSPLTLMGYSIRSAVKYIQGPVNYDGRYERVTWVGYACVVLEASYSGSIWIGEQVGLRVKRAWRKRDVLFKWTSKRISSIHRSIRRK